MREVDIMIVGAGPSGMSTALHLAQQGPKWAERTVVVDKAIYPREKLCGGAVRLFGTRILENLGLDFEPNHVTVNEIRILFEDYTYIFPEKSILRITCRDEFDHWLVRCGEKRGIEVRQGEEVIEVVAESQGIKVTTDSDTYLAKVLVAADGANSFVKRQLKWSNDSRIAHLLEIMTPENPEERFEFREGVAVFDFTPMMKGLQGYYWDFPNLVNGKPTMNRGVFDSRIHRDLPRIHLKDEFEVQLSRRGRNLSEYHLKGHPIHWFDAKAEFSRPHTLLVGDAAGTDPLLGEGIPFALAYGGAAALEIVEGWERGDFSFSTYKARVLEYSLLEQLRHRASVARFLYRLPKRPWLLKYFLKFFPDIFNFLAKYKPRYIPAKSPRMIRGNLMDTQ